MIDLQLLGGLDISGTDLPATARSRRRHPMMLLALVATAAPQPLSRERIMAFLWPESDAARASNSLRQAIHALRRDLGEDLFLPESSGGIQLDPARVTVDLGTFRDAVARRAHRDAVAAHRGPFLDGCQLPHAPEFSRWVESERAGVEREYLAALDALARESEAAGRHDEAVGWRRRQAAADPYSSRAALGLLKSLSAAGDRPGALAYAAVYESFVRTHLEVAPDPLVTEFVTEIRRVTPPGELTVRDITAAARSAERKGDVEMRGPVGMPWRSRASRALWMATIGIMGLSIVGVGAGYSMRGRADPVIFLGSGVAAVNGRDTSNLMIACEGHGCPEGGLPQPAFVVPKHVAYTLPAGDTRYIAPSADGTTVAAPGYACCSQAVFENRFTLPPDAATATISITLLADNQATVHVNGVEFGRQADSLAQWNFAGPPAAFATSFIPDPSGTNRLQVTLWNGGGVGGLDYRAIVTWDRKPAPPADAK